MLIHLDKETCCRSEIIEFNRDIIEKEAGDTAWHVQAKRVDEERGRGGWSFESK